MDDADAATTRRVGVAFLAKEARSLLPPLIFRLALPRAHPP